jgi:hypothetical protein
MLALFLLIALLVSDAAEAACPHSRSRSAGGSGGGKQATVGRPKILNVKKKAEYAVSCPSRPKVGCAVASSSRIVVRDEFDDSKDRLVWRWRGTAKSPELEIGDPSQSTTVGLCVYDSFEGHHILITKLRVEPGEAWSRRKSGAWHFKSSGQSSAGVTRIAAKTGQSGKTRLGVKARGKRLPFPLEPATKSKLYHKDRDVLVQLVTDASDACWTSAFPTAAENSTVSFVAPAPPSGAAVSAATR